MLDVWLCRSRKIECQKVIILPDMYMSTGYNACVSDFATMASPDDVIIAGDQPFVVGKLSTGNQHIRQIEGKNIGLQPFRGSAASDTP